MAEKFTRWDVTEHLRTKDDVRLYLEACADDDPGDGSLIRAALNDIVRAQNMSLLAREIGMTREGLYKALSENGNPTFATVMRIARALGMQLRITEPAEPHNLLNGKPNIFDHATKELSQDAMICWLIKWSAAPADDDSEKALRQLGCDFIGAMLAKHDKTLAGDVENVQLFRQDKGIDVLACVQDEGGRQHVFLIEDKTDTGDHSNQLQRYRDAVRRGQTCLGHVPEHWPIYLKTGNQSLHKARQLERETGYRVFDRADFLAVLNRYQGTDSIAMQFRAHLQSLEDDFNGWNDWTPEDRRNWSWAAWQGFYRALEDMFQGRDGEMDWGYVNPRSGDGFLGFWWFPFPDSDLPTYLQLETKPSDPSRQRLCFKVEPKDNGMRAQEYYELLREAAQTTGNCAIERPQRFGHGSTMTVAHWEGDWFEFGAGGTPDIDKIVQNFWRAQRILDSARRVAGDRAEKPNPAISPDNQP